MEQSFVNIIFNEGMIMTIGKWNRLVAVLLFSSTAFVASQAIAAGTPPTIVNACVIFPSPGVARISGIVTDPEFDAVAVTPLGVGTCLNGTPNVFGVVYICDVPAAAGSVTLVAVDSQG